MLIVGAKGFAKEVLEICKQNNQLDNLVFYDDVSNDVGEFLFGKFPILKDFAAAQNYLETIDTNFTIGIGNPKLRKLMTTKFEAIGGILSSTISPKSNIGSYAIEIGLGANVLDGACVSNDVSIGLAPIIYYNAIITHDCRVGDFCEISPGAKLLGRVKVGSFCQIGANSTILPGVKIGDNVIIGAGSVVTKDVPDNCTVVGVPAKIIHQNEA